jgi:ABC-type polysaccharide/polyol phosphate export permease
MLPSCCGGGDRQRAVLAHTKELFRFRNLLQKLVARDLRVRYKNSVLGILWSWLNPLFMMVVYTVVFIYMQGSDEGGVVPGKEFPVFVLCALLPWNFFSGAILEAISSIDGNAPLVKKVYFPREILPLSVVLSNLVNFGISLMILFPMLLLFGIKLTPWALLLPAIVVIQVCLTTGIALVLSTLNVFYRDTRAIMDVAMMAWFFVTPVIYPIDILPHSREILGITLDIHRWTRILNPMASLVAAYRDVLYFGRLVGLDFLARTAVTSLVVLLIGYAAFLKYSPRFGEEV